MSEERDMTPALGSPASPDFGVKSGEKVELHIGEWRDGEWSYLYGEDTKYAGKDRELGETPPLDGIGHGMMKAPVWTWEVPAYFWTGGMAAGSAFVAFACDVAGDHRAAALSRKVALGALAVSPPLLVLDLGRPMRFINMLRIVKTRSPMSTGAWALTVFGNLAAAAVGADLIGRPRLARAIGAANVPVAGYLGSYTGVLLASTAVPVWSRSRLFLGPIFVATATATGAAACRLAITAAGESDESTRVALSRIQAGAMAAELLLSIVNERRIGEYAKPLDSKMIKGAKWTVRAGLALQATRRPALAHVASVAYMAAALMFRYGWVRAGRASAGDDTAVARSNRPSPDGVSPGSSASARP
jgi:formate-dependent nitrite reductase membrane component NrfD